VKDTLVFDPVSHPVHEGRVVDLVEAGRDVPLEHPGVALGGEEVNLGNGRPALGASGGSHNWTA